MAKRVAALIVVVALAAIAVWWFGHRDARVENPAPVAVAPSPPPRPPDAFEMTVESVHDGDTLRAHVSTPNAVVGDLGSTRVRLLGIDTPEISPELDCWGAEATARLGALLPPGSTVWAAPDIQVRDQYGRHLLYLWTPDGRFVNAELVASGDARTEVYAPNTRHEALLRSLESSAREADAGQWGACR